MNFDRLRGYTLTKEEADACEELVEKMRVERFHQAKMETVRDFLSKDIATAIDMIGLDDTKRILRALNRVLRNCSADVEDPFIE